MMASAPAPSPAPAPGPAPAPATALVEAPPLTKEGLEFLDDTLERKYGALFHDVEAVHEDDAATVGTADTAATVRLRQVSNNELLHVQRQLDDLVSNRNALRQRADDRSLVAEQELYKAKAQETLAEAAWDHHVTLETQADNHPLGRGALSKDEVKALVQAQQDAERQKVLAVRQRATATDEHQLALKEEHLRQRAERACAKVAEKSLGAAKVRDERYEAQCVKAERTAQLEVQGAKRVLRGMEKRREEAKIASDKEIVQQEIRDRAAELGLQKAQVRVREKNKAQAKAKRKAEKARQKALEDRAEAIIEVKHNIEKAAGEIQALAEKRAIRDKKKMEAFELEKEAIEARGENSYQVFLQRDIDKKFEREKKAAIANLAKKKQEVIERIAKDDARQRKIDAKDHHDKQMAKKHRATLGRGFQQERTNAYLIEKTGRQLIDPTGRSVEPVFPSQETKMLDNTFGTGLLGRKTAEEREELIRKLAQSAEHAGPLAKDPYGEFARFVPKLKGAEALRLEQDQKQGEDDGRSALETFVPNDSKALVVKDEDMLAVKALSKFELDCRDKAQQRQKQRLQQGAPQVIAGTTLKSSAFVAQPAIIEYADFTPGLRHVLTIKLTNTSLSFNNFKLLPLADEVTDFFEINYIKPGRMSAGTSCFLEIAFTPQVDEDIFAELPFLAATGPFSVPIKCTTKKVLPSLSHEAVTFDDVVMGEERTIHLTIKNDGALPTQYTFYDPETMEVLGLKEQLRIETPTALAVEAPPSLLSPTPLSPTPTALLSLNEDETDEDGDAPAPTVEGEHDLDEEEEETRQLLAEEALVEKAARVHRRCLQYKDGLTALQFKGGGSVEGHAQTTHAITFAPLRAGYERQAVLVKFEGVGEPLEFSILGSSIEVPIYLEEPLQDLRCCVYGKLYRKKLLVKNRGKIAMKCTASVPPKFSEWLEYQPDSGFVQPGQSFEMSLKFRPGPGLLEASRGYRLEDVIALPLKLKVPDQVLPVYYTLKARLTSGDIDFSSMSLKYGDCYVGEGLSMPLTLTNTSLLPQKYGFVQLKDEIDVLPEAIGILLPKESRQVNVVFKPRLAQFCEIPVVCKTTMNMTYTLTVKGQGVDPPLNFKQTVMHLAPCQPGDSEVASFFVSHPLPKGHKRGKPRTFEIRVPKPLRSHLTVQPCVAVVGPGETRRIEVTFAPPRSKGPKQPALRDANDERVEPDYKSVLGLPDDPPPPPAEEEEAPEPEDPRSDEELRELADNGDAKALEILETREAKHALEAKAKAEADARLEAERAPPELWEGTFEVSKHRVEGQEGYAPLMNEDDVEPWSEHGAWKLPCFIQKQLNEKTAPPPMMLEVHTTCVERILWCDCDRLDFGQLAVGQTKTLPLRLRNLAPPNDQTVFFVKNSAGLNAVGPFCVLNALRPLPPRAPAHVCLVQFTPFAKGLRSEVLELTCPQLGRTLRIELCGEGVSPTLELDPEDGKLDLGHVAAGRSSTKELRITNTSVFPLSYALKSVGDAQPRENRDGSAPFLCIPSEATVAPGETQVVQCTFRPDHGRAWPFTSELHVSVPNEAKRHVLYLTGHGHDEQLYVCKPGLLIAQPASLENFLELPVSECDADREASEAMGLATRLVPRLEVRFPRDGDGATQSVFVGCCANDAPDKSVANPSTLSGTGAFEIEWSYDDARAEGLFSAAPDKGSAAAGGETEVTFAFNPPESTSSVELDVGRWVRAVATFLLKGAPRDSAFEVELSGYLPTL